MKNNILEQVLVEYSKVNFDDYANLDNNLSDLANIDITVPGAQLIALCIIKKTANLKGNQLRNKGKLVYSSPKYKIRKVEVLESRIIADGDAVEFSSYRLSAAHEEKLHLRNG